MTRILLADDDVELCEMLADYLGVEGFAVEAAHDGDTALRRVLDAQPDLDGSYTVFGEVISGMEAVQSLVEQDPRGGSNQPEADLILRASIEER